MSRRCQIEMLSKFLSSWKNCQKLGPKWTNPFKSSKLPHLCMHAAEQQSKAWLYVKASIVVANASVAAELPHCKGPFCFKMEKIQKKWPQKVPNGHKLYQNGNTNTKCP
jgi:hypothetical protein